MLGTENNFKTLEKSQNIFLFQKSIVFVRLQQYFHWRNQVPILEGEIVGNIFLPNENCMKF